MFGDDGKWGHNATERPDYLAIQVLLLSYLLAFVLKYYFMLPLQEWLIISIIVFYLCFQLGLHTCVHAYNNDLITYNKTTLDRHIADLTTLMVNVRRAVDRHSQRTGLPPTQVIIVTAGRCCYSGEIDKCTWRFNRIAAIEAHKQGFAVFEREEIERRLLFKSEGYENFKPLAPKLHLEMPGPSIVATSMLGLISCLVKNQTLAMPGIDQFKVFTEPPNSDRRKVARH